jgi:hypothetical protein
MVSGDLAATAAVRPVLFAPTGVRIFRRDGASSYGWWGNLAVVLGRHPPDAAHVANYRACIVELHKRFPQGIGVVTVVNDTSTPSPSGREAMIAMFKELWPAMNAALFVPNASGFKAAVLRSVMGCFILVSGQRDRVRVEPSVRAGMSWLTTKILGEDGHSQLQLLEKGILQFCEAESDWRPGAHEK